MVEFCKKTFGRVIGEVSTNQLLLIFALKLNIIVYFIQVKMLFGARTHVSQHQST